MTRWLFIWLVACSPDETTVEQPPPPAPRISINELNPILSIGPLGAIATNAIPAFITVPLTPGAATMGGLPPRVLPPDAHVGLPPVINAAALVGLDAPADFTVASTGTLTIGEHALRVAVSAVVVDGVAIDASQIKNCSVKGFDVTRATAVDLDLAGADLDELVVLGLPLALARDVRVTGLTASSIRCDCAAGAGRELSQCLEVAAPYAISLRAQLVDPPPDARVTLARLHTLLASRSDDGAPSPFCAEAGSPCGTACTGANGSCVNNACVLADSDGDGAPGYVVDGISIDTLDKHLRLTAAAAFKIAFHPRVSSTLVCETREFDFAGEVGTAGLFGGTRWSDATDARVREQQRWFSAAFMALVNPWGKRVHVSLRHPDGGPTQFGSGVAWPDALRPFPRFADADFDGTQDDLTILYPQVEGTYYGNLFVGTCTTGHPDCAYGLGAGVHPILDYIRTPDLENARANIVQAGLTIDECRTRIEAEGVAFDPARHYTTSSLDATTYWCLLEPRTCAAPPVLAQYFCPFETDGYAGNYCTTSAPELGYASCVGNDPADVWTEQVSVFLHRDAEPRFVVSDAIACRAHNKLRISVGGCSDAVLADCDGDGVVDGCIDGTR